MPRRSAVPTNQSDPQSSWNQHTYTRTFTYTQTQTQSMQTDLQIWKKESENFYSEKQTNASLRRASSLGSQHDATRICCSARTATDRYLLQAPALSSKPATRRCCRRSTEQIDGRTDTRPLRRTCSPHIMQAALTSCWKDSCHCCQYAENVPTPTDIP